MSTPRRISARKGSVRRLLRMSRELHYSVLDVFAEHPLEGNPLAVFHDARSLSDAEMQALARETNLAETTFIVPEEAEVEAREGVRVRIFTTQEELPFAGHPALGTATWLWLHHPVLRGADMVTLRLNVGLIVVRFEPPLEGAPGAWGTMRQKEPVFGASHDRSAVAEAIGLQENDLSQEYVPQTVSTGMAFCIVLLRSVEALRRLQISQREAQAWLDRSDAKFFYCIARAEASDAVDAPDFHARMQFYGGEDPATGSASGCCMSWLVKQGLVAPGRAVVIEQGVEIRRPSRITAQASLTDGRVHSVLVSGRTIPVAEGRFFLP
jgi:trans-2,3-dihydro-3-hydroxyanthranilate isomerase